MLPADAGSAGPSDDEASLATRSRQGDAMAFAKLVALHQGRVRAYIGGSIRRPDVVDDLAQEVFLSGFRSLGTYKGESSFGVWLLGIARHKVLTHLHREVRRLSHESDTVESVLTPFRVELVESENMLLARREHEISALRRCLDGLPEDAAGLIARRYFEASDISTIARDLGKRAGAIRMTLLRLRQALRSCVEQRLAKENHV
jgi:RNA polymerase sigma-70 factor (ECF subfamily)